MHLPPQPRERRRAPAHSEATIFFRGTLMIAAIVLAAIVLAAPATAQQRSGDKDSSQADSYSERELEVVRLINDYRAQNGLEPLQVSDTASTAAANHSEDMGEYGFFGHDTVQSSYYPEDATFDERLTAEGYDHQTQRAENLAAGNDSAQATFEQWRNSPEHDENMLREDLKVMGVGLVCSGDYRYDCYWTTNFGGVADESARAPSDIDPPGADADSGDSPADASGQDGSGPDSTENTTTGEDSSSIQDLPPAQSILPEEDTSEEDTSAEDTSSETTTEDTSAEDTASEIPSSRERPGDNSSRQYADEGSSEEAETSDPPEDTAPSGQEPSGQEPSGSSEDQYSGQDSSGSGPSESGTAEDCTLLEDFDSSPLDEGYSDDLQQEIDTFTDCVRENADKKAEGGSRGSSGSDGSTSMEQTQSAERTTVRQDSEGSDAEGPKAERDEPADNPADDGGIFGDFLGEDTAGNGSEDGSSQDRDSTESTGDEQRDGGSGSIGEGFLE